MLMPRDEKQFKQTFNNLIWNELNSSDNVKADAIKI